jgi:hypothetical protein
MMSHSVEMDEILEAVARYIQKGLNQSCFISKSGRQDGRGLSGNQ